MSDDERPASGKEGSGELDNFSELLRNMAPRGIDPPPASGTPVNRNRSEGNYDPDAPVRNNGEIYFSSAANHRQTSYEQRRVPRRTEDGVSVSANDRTPVRRQPPAEPSTPVFTNGSVRHGRSDNDVSASKNVGEAYRRRVSRFDEDVPVVTAINKVETGGAPVRRPSGGTRQFVPANQTGTDNRSAGARAEERRRPPASDPGTAEKPKRQKQTSQTKKKVSGTRIALRFLSFLLVVFIIVGASAAITIIGISCGNDIFAVGKDTSIVTVEIKENMRTQNIIELLNQKGLIDNLFFCQKIAPFLGFDDEDKYVAGTYYITKNWGLEKMLNEMQDSGEKETVKLTFPEGYTVDRIAEKLETYDVCSAQSFFEAINNYDFSGEFTFLGALSDASSRYRLLEGYLYPDTYDFFVGENATSVIKKFLSNFTQKWTDEYAARAAELGMSTDKVVILASITEKEGNDADQMKLVSSVLHNRLNNLSVYTNLQCDSTGDYVKDISDDYVSEAQRENLLKLYDTYVRSGYPVGAICNPGDAAINAVLYPEETDYYFFRHDKKGRIYMAENQEAHEENGRIIDRQEKQAAE